MNDMRKKEHIKSLYEKELSLLEELESCLTAERECLLKSNISALSFVKREKEKIFRDIRDIQEMRRNFIKEEADGPVNYEFKDLARFKSRLNICRSKVRTQIKENMEFIQDMLGFFEGLISNILLKQDTCKTYKELKRARRDSSSVAVRTEV